MTNLNQSSNEIQSVASDKRFKVFEKEIKLAKYIKLQNFPNENNCN